MLKVRLGEKGVVLFIVLGVILITATLSAVILSLVVSHYRLTHHQSSRIQSYYASMAGVNYALEQLRTGAWIAGINCTVNSPCILPFAADDFKPASIVGNSVSIVIRQPGPNCSPPSGSSVCISTTATYTYTP